MRHFLYRYDPIRYLRRHRSLGALRARRVCTQEYQLFIPVHRQLTDALESLSAGDGLFCLSAWKDLDTAIAMLRFDSRLCRGDLVPVLQRIRADHPCFDTFHRGDDEHLADAWLFWKTERLCGNPDWSADGIPHADIEVLLQDGHWVPFNEAPWLPGNAMPDWRRLCVDVGQAEPLRCAARTIPGQHGCDVVVYQADGELESVPIDVWAEEHHYALLRSLLAEFPAWPDFGRILIVRGLTESANRAALNVVRTPSPFAWLGAIASAAGLRAAFQPTIELARADAAWAELNAVCAAAGLGGIETGDGRWRYPDALLAGPGTRTSHAGTAAAACRWLTARQPACRRSGEG